MRKRGEAGVFETAIIFFVVCLLIQVDTAAAIQIAVTGDWSRDVTSDDLAGGPGTDLNDTYESDSDQALITISDTSGHTWRVDVRRVDTDWPGGLVLSVRRTGDGTGGGTIMDGTSYQAVGTLDGEFFSGSGDRSGIPIQSKVSGVSVELGRDTYSTTVIYTVVDTQ